VPPVRRLEQLEALEAVLVIYRAGPGGEPVSELIAAVGGHGNRVDPHDRHATIMPAPSGVKSRAAGNQR
jgi:hypothetical protein